MNTLFTHLNNSRQPVYGLACWLILMMIILTFNANAGIGSVWTTGVTENSISISWTPPTGDYQLSNDLADDYMVCYEVSGSWATVCGGGTVQYTSSSSFTITGLNSGTSYKIRVKCHCERQNIWGNWKNPKWRTIGTNISTTDVATTGPGPVTSYLITPSVTPFSIDVEMDHSYMPFFSATRICYKKRWHPVLNFYSTCYTNPATSWHSSTKNLGWLDGVPASPATFTINPAPLGLKDCTQYVIAGYGDNTFIGETMVRTSGLCGFFNKSMLVLQDYPEDVLFDYALALEGFYRKPLLDHLAQAYEPGLYELQQIFRQNNQENLADTTTMLAYLIESNTDLYERWQQEASLKQAGLSLELFLQQQYPELNKALNDELAVNRKQR